MKEKILFIGALTISALCYGGPAIAENMSLTKTLKRGFSGVEVTALQNFLKQDINLYPEGLVTGYFGPATERAIKRFQAQYNIEQVGIVGPKTRAKLNALLAATTQSITTSETPKKTIESAPTVTSPVTPPPLTTPTIEYPIIPQGFSLLWKYQVSEALIQPPAIGNDGVIYYSAGKTLYAFNADRSLKWKFEGRGVLSAPLITNEQYAYVASTDGIIYALRSDGTERWKFTASPASSFTTSPSIGEDGTIYIGAQNKKLYAISYDGGQRWAFDTEGAIETSPAVDLVNTQEIIYVASLDKKLYAVNKDGKLKRSTLLGDVSYSAPALASNQIIYLGADDGKLYAINTEGSIVWIFQAGGKIRSSPIIDNEGTIYVTADDGKLYAVAHNGVLRWSYTLTSQTTSLTITPTIGSEGDIYAPADNGVLYVINTDGTLRGLFTLGQSSKTAPAIGVDGAVYVGADKTLYGIETNSKGLASSAWPKFKKDNRNTARSGLPGLRSATDTATAQLASALDALAALLKQLNQ